MNTYIKQCKLDYINLEGFMQYHSSIVTRQKKKKNYLIFMSIQKIQNFNFCLKLKYSYYFILITIHI